MSEKYNHRHTLYHGLIEHLQRPLRREVGLSSLDAVQERLSPHRGYDLETSLEDLE